MSIRAVNNWARKFQTLRGADIKQKKRGTLLSRVQNSHGGTVLSEL